MHAAHIGTMAFDLGRAMLKKQEHESARLMDFEFRHRARTFRLLARALGMDEAAVVKRTARGSDEEVLAWLEEQVPQPPAELRRLYVRCSAEARTALIKELGDPTPHRLA
jgi:hypothetical protein